jgi:hypothetical protein
MRLFAQYPFRVCRAKQFKTHSSAEVSSASCSFRFSSRRPITQRDILIKFAVSPGKYEEVHLTRLQLLLSVIFSFDITLAAERKPRRRCEDNIKIDFKGTGWGGMDWIDLVQDRDQWRALVNTMMKLQVP